MPAALSYPGVYVQELQSQVHAVTGVSTSVTAFVGVAARGPLNKPVRILGFADFERRFGGLDDGSDLSYAVRQYFINGGSEAWIVRIAKNAFAASRDLINGDGATVLGLTALDKGSAGNDVHVVVDHDTSNPESTFNLTLTLEPDGGNGEVVVETYQNLSMSSKDARYAESVINQSSALVSAKRPATLPAGLATAKGVASSGDLTGLTFGTLIDGAHNTLRVSLNGKPPVKVTLNTAAGNADADLLAAVKGPVETALGAANLVVTFSTSNGKHLVLTSQAVGEASTVQVLPGETQDAAGRLKLGTLFGGSQVDGSALIRPALAPEPAELTGGAIAAPADLDAIPSAGKQTLKVLLDGQATDVTLDGPAIAGATVADRLGDLAPRLEAAVRALRPANPAFAGFSAAPDGNKLALRSGTRGLGSSIEVRPATGDTLASVLKLTAATGADLSGSTGVDLVLAGGSEAPLDIGSPDAYNQFIGSRAAREGIYALEGVDLFNLLVLAAVSDPGILMDAASYCTERRAFLIVDLARDVDTPDEAEKAVSGTAVPRTANGAAYFPWIKIADPLAGGRLRDVAPSGTIAGLFARIDSARGVWKAPAGTEATLAGAQGVTYTLTDLENGVLNPRGLNCLRLFPVFGPVSWGARTLLGDDQLTSEWKYVPVRRLALFLEESLYRGTKWAVFEPNDERLWGELRLNIGAFMQDLFRQGAFAGQSPREAYFVKCDRDTTTQNDINLGIVNAVIGFAPLKPAEFVVLSFQQLAGQIKT